MDSSPLEARSIRDRSNMATNYIFNIEDGEEFYIKRKDGNLVFKTGDSKDDKWEVLCMTGKADITIRSDGAEPFRFMYTRIDDDASDFPCSD